MCEEKENSTVRIFFIEILSFYRHPERANASIAIESR